jgi:DNA-binding transcriptional LysR family regulator
MNFLNLEYFLVVASEGNITRAAERLNVSQQALSNSIARLEKELSCKLFYRKKDLTLTYAGKQFKTSAEKILDIKRQTQTVLDEIGEGGRGELRIGISYTRGQAILPLLLPAFSRRYPLVELHVTEGSTHVLEEDLDRGRIDVLIGFAPFMVESAEYTELMKDHLYLVLPKTLMAQSFGNKAQEVLDEYKENMDISLFKDLPFILLKEGDRIRAIVDREFYAKGLKPQIKLETQNIQTAFALASEGMGLAVCPELYLGSSYVTPGMSQSLVRKKVDVLPFSNSLSQDAIAIGYNRERHLSHFALDFINTALETFGKKPML